MVQPGKRCHQAKRHQVGLMTNMGRPEGNPSLTHFCAQNSLRDLSKGSANRISRRSSEQAGRQQNIYR